MERADEDIPHTTHSTGIPEYIWDRNKGSIISFSRKYVLSIFFFSPLILKTYCFTGTPAVIYINRLH